MCRKQEQTIATFVTCCGILYSRSTGMSWKKLGMYVYSRESCNLVRTVSLCQHCKLVKSVGLDMSVHVVEEFGIVKLEQ